MTPSVSNAVTGETPKYLSSTECSTKFLLILFEFLITTAVSFAKHDVSAGLPKPFSSMQRNVKRLAFSFSVAAT